MESLLGGGERLQPWWRGRSWRFWLTVSSPLLVMGACGLFSIKARKIASAAEREAAVFHQRVAGEQYDAIYDTASPVFRAAVSRADSARYFAAIHVKMGACKIPSGSPTYFTNTSTSGTRVQLRYRLQCANGALQETLLYAFTGDGPRLAGYDANSPTLILR
jgi:hypothetical protein